MIGIKTTLSAITGCITSRCDIYELGLKLEYVQHPLGMLSSANWGADLYARHLQNLQANPVSLSRRNNASWITSENVEKKMLFAISIQFMPSGLQASFALFRFNAFEVHDIFIPL
jgi:hypothetical protein